MRFAQARYVYLSAFLVVAGYAIVTLRGPTGVPGLWEKRRQIELLQKRNSTLAQENDRKREHIRRLTDNPAEQELEIRRQLKLVQPGEKVFNSQDQDKK